MTDTIRGVVLVFPCGAWLSKSDIASLTQTLLPAGGGGESVQLLQYDVSVYTSDIRGAGEDSQLPCWSECNAWLMHNPHMQKQTPCRCCWYFHSAQLNTTMFCQPYCMGELAAVRSNFFGITTATLVGQLQQLSPSMALLARYVRAYAFHKACSLCFPNHVLVLIQSYLASPGAGESLKVCHKVHMAYVSVTKDSIYILLPTYRKGVVRDGKALKDLDPGRYICISLCEDASIFESVSCLR